MKTLRYAGTVSKDFKFGQRYEIQQILDVIKMDRNSFMSRIDKRNFFVDYDLRPRSKKTHLNTIFNSLEEFQSARYLRMPLVKRNA